MRADAAVTINGLVRWTINHGARRPRGLGGHAGHGRRRDLRQRAFRRPADRRAGRRACGWSTATASSRDVPRGGDGVRLRSQPPAGHRRDAAVGRRSRVARGDPAALRATARESLAFRKRTQPLDTPSAGCIFQNPGAAAATRAGGHSVVGRRAGRSRRPERRARSAARASRRRTATSS